MSEHRPLTRSRSKKSRVDGAVMNGLDPAYIPPPLNIRKANAVAPSQTQRFDPTAIGLAVGSPKDSPLPPVPNRKRTNTEPYNFRLPIEHKARPSTDESRGSRESKTIGARWKTFGSFFSRRETPSRTEAPPHYPAPPVRPEWQSGPPKTSQSSRKRAGSDKEKAMEQQNMPNGAQMAHRPSLIRRASSKRRAAQRRKPSQARVERNRSNRNSAVLAANHGLPPITIRQAVIAKQQEDFSLLQIEIPNVEMERYSIMFGNVLNGSPNASRTSLARPSKSRMVEPKPTERRPQAARTDSGNSQRGRDALRSVENTNGLDPPKPHRRDGSASSTGSKSPSFSLFPSTSTSPNRGGSPARIVANKPLPKPSPLSRSVTAPDPSNILPRPALKTVRSDDIAQPIPIAPGKENVPVSKWNTHSRQGSRASTNSQDFNSPSQGRPISHGHVAELSVNNNYYRHSHSRNPSLEPPDSSHQSHASLGSKYLDVSEFSSNNRDLQGPAVRPQTPDTPITAQTKQTFINRAFPTRKSSLKRPKTAGASSITTAPTLTPATTAYQQDKADMPGPPKPPYVTAPRGAPFHGSSESVSSATEVSIARQISISKRQRQLLVPVVAKTARQPLQPQVIDGEGRKSELVLFGEGDSPTREVWGQH